MSCSFSSFRQQPREIMAPRFVGQIIRAPKRKLGSAVCQTAGGYTLDLICSAVEGASGRHLHSHLPGQEHRRGQFRTRTMMSPLPYCISHLTLTGDGRTVDFALYALLLVYICISICVCHALAALVTAHAVVPVSQRQYCNKFGRVCMLSVQSKILRSFKVPNTPIARACSCRS